MRSSKPSRVYVQAHYRRWPQPRCHSFNPYVMEAVCRDRIMAALHAYRQQIIRRGFL